MGKAAFRLLDGESVVLAGEQEEEEEEEEQEADTKKLVACGLLLSKTCLPPPPPPPPVLDDDCSWPLGLQAIPLLPGVIIAAAEQVKSKLFMSMVVCTASCNN